MARIYPNPCLMSTSTSVSTSSSGGEGETLTVWMKSLVCHGNGCTVFNSKGEVVFRVDNYQRKCNTKVFLMDSVGRLLFSLHRQKLGIFGCWEGFKWNDCGVRMERPWFKVRKNKRIMSKDICCEVTLGCEESSYKIKGFQGKSRFEITNSCGKILAEATEKVSAGGVHLGDDVLTLMVESDVDLALIMALVTLYGLMINYKL